MTVDPVCKAAVDEQQPPGGKAQYWGKTYYFCAPGCRAAFQQRPNKYADQPSESDEPTYDPRMFLGDM